MKCSGLQSPQTVQKHPVQGKWQQIQGVFRRLCPAPCAPLGSQQFSDMRLFCPRTKVMLSYDKPTPPPISPPARRCAHRCCYGWWLAPIIAQRRRWLPKTKAHHTLTAGGRYATMGLLGRPHRPGRASGSWKAPRLLSASILQTLYHLCPLSARRICAAMIFGLDKLSFL